MSIGTTGALALGHGTRVGLVWLVALLIGVLGLTAGFTGYLFRAVSRPASLVHAAPPPHPYALTLFRGADLLTLQDGRSRRVATLPASLAAGLSATSSAPDGGHLLLASGASRGDRLWMISLRGGELREVALPSAPPGGWRYLTSRWTSGEGVTAILAAGRRANAPLVVARIAAGGVLQALTPWVPPADARAGVQRLASLSTDAGQVALLERLGGGGGFQSQVLVKLQHLSSPRASIADRYLGEELPSAVLWSPDDGTVAIAAPGAGLAIQKASGRPVRRVQDGYLPGAFSAGVARFCYLEGGSGRWQFHVIDLHSEMDSAVGSTLQGRPAWVSWTPDGRAILYMVGDQVWALDPVVGTVRRLGAVPGMPLAVQASQ